ncbi:general transcription factor IIH subunit 1-like [Amphiura filiformis]|uniref:general transcription factor IIH subunit 1-like n=1 Tax=Amphiura filiformis TaxID=82378 RepID=UPI003B20E3C7
MAASSEEVLLVTNQVRHAKKDGTLYLMAERLAWQEENKDIFNVSHHYADIKQQKISPEGSSKVQLQIVLHNGSSSKFHFANRDGPAVQKKERTDIKELMQQLLPRFRSMANKELEQKNRMLQENPELFQLYKDLVISGVMSAEEFWASRKPVLESQPSVSSKTQTTGVSAAFLSDIKPQTDGCNGVKYNLTADIIESIFRIYPAVKKKHAENVPNNMTEKEFWTRFFQSQYFHRDRINAGSQDLFTECAKHDEKDLQEETMDFIKDPLLNVEGLSDQTLGEGYGCTLDKTNPSSSNAINSSIIKRFNHHNTRVLSVSQSKSSSLLPNNVPSTTSTSNSNTNSNNHKTQPRDNENGEPKAKRVRLKESISYADLAPSTSGTPVTLKLERTEGYYHGPTPISAFEYSSAEEVMGAMHRVHEETVATKTKAFQALSSSMAGAVMNELTPGGALMGASMHQPLHAVYSKEIQHDLKRLYTSLAELLRHFWSCFPVSSKAVEEKLMRMKGTLEQYQTKKLQPFKDSLAKQHIGPNLTIHIEELLETAYNKYSAWQAKKMGMSRR